MGQDMSLIQSLKIVRKVKCTDCSVTLPVSLEVAWFPQFFFFGTIIAIARI